MSALSAKYSDDFVNIVRTKKEAKNLDLLTFKTQLKEFLTISLDRCMKSVGAHSGSLFLLDYDKKELVLSIAQRGNSSVLKEVRTRLGERVMGKVALERKAILVSDIDNEPSFQMNPQFDYHSKSFISVPLEFSGDLFGVINLTDKDGGMVFTDIDLNTVSLICKHLGIALHTMIKYLEKQRELSDELLKALGDLKNVSDKDKKFSSIGKFAGGLVHEINNPLDGVIRFVNLSLDTLKEEDLSREYLLEAKKGLNRIAQFVRSLLNFSWSLSSPDAEMDIGRALEETLFYFAPTIKDYNIAVERSIAADLPKVPDLGLKIVFNNLIKNAIEAMTPDGGQLKISASATSDIIEIKFTDTGKGIPSQIIERIFDPFFTTKSMGQGSGLGLAITYEIIERCQGAISVKSQEGKGATFLVRLPVKEKIGVAL